RPTSALPPFPTRRSSDLDRMKRREFITLLGGVALATPLAAHAQQAVVPVIGFLHAGSPEVTPSLVAGFRRGLSETGFIDGRNVADRKSTRLNSSHQIISY